MAAALKEVKIAIVGYNASSRAQWAYNLFYGEKNKKMPAGMEHLVEVYPVFTEETVYSLWHFGTDVVLNRANDSLYVGIDACVIVLDNDVKRAFQMFDAVHAASGSDCKYIIVNVGSAGDSGDLRHRMVVHDTHIDVESVHCDLDNVASCYNVLSLCTPRK